MRAAVSFVNRGRKLAVRLPLVQEAASGPLVCPSGACKVWLVNLSDSPLTVTAGGVPVTLAPHALDSRPFRGTVDVEGRVLAFATTTEPPTRFVWPHGVRP